MLRNYQIKLLTFDLFLKIILFSISKLEFENCIIFFTPLITAKMNDEMIATAQKEKIKFLKEFTEKKIELTDNTSSDATSCANIRLILYYTNIFFQHL